MKSNYERFLIYLDSQIHKDAKTSLPFGKRGNVSTITYFENDYEKYEWLENLKNNKNPTIEYYNKNPIEYNWNKDGFRRFDDYEFEEGGDVNIFLGCSDTMGQAMHIENTWSYKLHHYIKNDGNENIKYWNLGIGGTGIDTHLRILYFLTKKYHNKINVRNIFYWAPFRNRFEMYQSDENYYFTMVSKEEDELFLKLPYELKWNYMNDSTVGIQYSNHINAMNNIATKLNSNFYILNYNFIWDWETIVNRQYNIFNDESYNNKLSFLKARDLTHPSYNDNQAMFQAFKSLVNKNPLI